MPRYHSRGWPPPRPVDGPAAAPPRPWNAVASPASPPRSPPAPSPRTGAAPEPLAAAATATTSGAASSFANCWCLHPAPAWVARASWPALPGRPAPAAPSRRTLCGRRTLRCRGSRSGWRRTLRWRRSLRCGWILRSRRALGSRPIRCLVGARLRFLHPHHAVVVVGHRAQIARRPPVHERAWYTPGMPHFVICVSSKLAKNGSSVKRIGSRLGFCGGPPL